MVSKRPRFRHLFFPHFSLWRWCCVFFACGGGGGGWKGRGGGGGGAGGEGRTPFYE
jgi:hypothetical protein